MNITAKQMDELALRRIHIKEVPPGAVRTSLLEEFDAKSREFCGSDPQNKEYVENNLASWTEKLRKRLADGFTNSQETEDAEREAEFRKTGEVKLALVTALLEETQKEQRAKKQETLAPQTLAISAFQKKRTPINWVSEISRDLRLGWDSDARSDRKAYIFACFSEIAYLKYTKHDLPVNARYKVVPSEALENLRTYEVQYDLEKVLRSLNGGEGITVTNNDPGRGFSYSTFRTRNFIVVAVRGTVPTSSADVLIDLKFFHTKEGYHKGFYTEAQTAMAEIKLQETLIEAAAAKLPVYFTGHSLGAAIAWIFRHIWGDSHRIMTPYIYAPPRIGTNVVSDLHPVYAYIRTNDPVPHLPPMTFSFEDPLNGQAVDTETNESMWKKFAKILKNHAIERYRVELGQKTKDDQFDPDVYFTALFAEMIDTYRMLGQPFPFGVGKLT
jgi:predicted lipase